MIEKYCDLNFYQFPVYGVQNNVCLCKEGLNCKTPGKHPSINKGFYSATNKVEELQRLLKSRKYPNIGIRTGKISNLIALDIDPKNDGYESIKKLKASWPITPTSETGSGGEHRLFTYPINLIVKSTTDLLPGVDIRAEGGYIVAPPSLHVSGRRYSWDTNFNLDSVEIAPPPDWLIELILKKQKQKQESSINTNWKDLTNKMVIEGGRNNHILKLCGHLIAKNVDVEVCFNLLSAINQTKCQPPLEADEILKILKFVASKHFERNRRYGKRYSTIK